MGHKVNPKAFRLGNTITWNSQWFATNAKFSAFLEQDVKLRKFLVKELRDSAMEQVKIERANDAITLNIYTGKPGVIIGRSGAGVEDLKKKIKQKFLLGKANLNINIKEVERVALSASLVMQEIIASLEKRIPFRRAVKQAVGKVMRAGALGVKVIVGGRLNGAEIARSETVAEGSLPLHTLRADIDYCRGAARTIYGAIGVKVWIYKRDVFKKGN